MLKSLSISNIAVIERAIIDFDGGLNVLTGETGARKDFDYRCFNNSFWWKIF